MTKIIKDMAESMVYNFYFTPTEAVKDLSLYGTRYDSDAYNEVVDMISKGFEKYADEVENLSDNDYDNYCEDFENTMMRLWECKWADEYEECVDAFVENLECLFDAIEKKNPNTLFDMLNTMCDTLTMWHC